MNEHVTPPSPPDWPSMLAILRNERALMEQAARQVKKSALISIVCAVLVCTGAILNVLTLVATKWLVP